MALTKTVTALISNQTVPANSYIVSSSSIDLSEAIDLELTCTLAFTSSATAPSNIGARVELYSDPSGANSSFSIGTRDEPLDSFDIIITAGYSKTKTEQMKRCSKFAKVKLVNLSNQSITAATVRAIMQSQ